MRDITRIRFSPYRLVIISREWFARSAFCVAFVLFFIMSLNPWFFWEWDLILTAFVAALLGLSYLFGLTIPGGDGHNRAFVLPTLFYVLLSVYMYVANDGNFNGLFRLALFAGTFAIIFRTNPQWTKMAVRGTSKVMALLLAVSLVAFYAYVLGVSMPYSTCEYQDIYSFYNYRFFMIRDWDAVTIIPRFNSVFLEPSHMSTAAIFLLMCEIGRWKKWYNIILIVSVVASFSLEGYALMFGLFFLSKWVMRQHFVRNLMILIGVFSAIIVGVLCYNGGENMVSDLIFARLEIEDGEMAGNNRTTDDFDATFSNFIYSGSILTGRGVPTEKGNSGYKVFMYTYGLIGTFLLFAFYASILYNPRNKRPAWSATAVAFVHFMVQAHMMWSSCVLPMYYTAQWFRYKPDETDATENEELRNKND